MPIFSPKAATNFNYMSESSIPIKVVGKKNNYKDQYFFNQTATLVGLSSNLLGTEFDEANMDICEDDIAKPIAPKKKRGASGTRMTSANNTQISNQVNDLSNNYNHPPLSETQNIDMSSLNLLPLQLIYQIPQKD